MLRRHRRSGPARSPEVRQAVLDQYRAVQQPDSPEIRAESAAGRLLRGGEPRGREWRAPAAPRRRGGRAPVRALRSDVLRPLLRAAGDEQDAGRRPRHARGERKQPLRRRTHVRSGRVRRALSAQLEARENRPGPRRGGVSRRRQVRRAHRAHRAASRGRRALRAAGNGRCAAGIDPLLSDRRRGRPRAVRHRVGARPGLFRRYDQRVRRGLHGRPGNEGRVGGAGLLRQCGKDAEDPDAGRARPVVRGPYALGATLSQAERARRHRKGDRGGDRDGRFGPDHAGGHQPAERSVHPRVGTAASRCPCRTSTRRTTRQRPKT